MKVAFATLGCRVNVYETEAMTEIFKKDGYEVVPFEEYADVYVVNTCTVTNMSDKKSRKIISKARKNNENAIIAAVGCYSQIAPDKVAEVTSVDVVLGTRNKGDILYWINRAKEEQKQMVAVSDVMKNTEFEDLKIEEFTGKTRAFLKIQDGCNSFCSYCLIPYSRGAVCSKSPEMILEEIKVLASHGFKEVIFTGISISSYGKDLEGEWDLITILEKASEIEGIERIRIGSIGPRFFTDEIIERISKIEKMCPHYHLSLQSGCDETLKRMNRNYTSKQYKDIVNKLRDKMPDLSITTDIIVGFPGETEEEFLETFKFLQDLKLAKTHIFKYSERKGTKASSMEGQINGKIKEERSKKLIALNEKNEKEFISSFVGKKLDVLYEQNNDELKQVTEGYTTNYIKVVLQENEANRGEIISTEITKVGNEFAFGEI
ncbi:tRNA (N(6)-L-threonylcarbamoyladenosine(37)-C(2))-methylthiotransferase MtaB [Clostridium grantii]|uniref:Threonylcarbamoyladenosine tRNA methylthiotransferase MtaB n=1 Tax=Clostridium grantii DSM 8605 TaxID=1121316 RepID=A0A1M5XLH6_9CLOT|nr:tRNA (N(6)-L-threonylcarbamoyladenosine(37)-C(2))-methylthiotransferase MtaB [Clostridium grantii]SHI00398.1 threonylcarbamoyladenosine tRNA methylthiotransferase MtaB [Clostridium grantii DSM 8605]